MKYEVTVTQEVRYTDRITGIFDNLVEVQQFIAMIMAHFEKVSASIELVIETEESEDEE